MKVSPHPSLRTLHSGARLLGLLRLQGPVAQSGERRPRMAEVTSSSLVGSTSEIRLNKRETAHAGKGQERVLDLTTPTVTPTWRSEDAHGKIATWPMRGTC